LLLYVQALAAITNEAMVQIISRHISSKDTFEGFWRVSSVIKMLLDLLDDNGTFPGVPPFFFLFFTRMEK
jgi:hypothetical protein